MLTPTRKFIKQDDIELTVENFDGPAKCYLFNDLIILAGEKKGKVLPTMTYRFANYFSWGAPRKFFEIWKFVRKKIKFLVLFFQMSIQTNYYY